MELLQRKYDINYSDMIIKTKDDFVVNAETLWNELSKPQSHFVDWMKRKILPYFTENIDYKIYVKNCLIGRNKAIRKLTRYVFTLNCAIAIVKNTKYRDNEKVLIYLYSLTNKHKEILIKEPPRLEYQFANMLEKITGLEWKKQYPIDKIPRTLVTLVVSKWSTYVEQKL